MPGWLADLFSGRGFPPRWSCGDWSPALGWTHILSDAAIFGAYITIPLILLALARRRRDIPFQGVFLLFGAFIFACGLTHLNEAVIFYHPYYRFAGVVKMATALVSWATVAAMVPIVPRVLALRRPEPFYAKIAAQDAALERQRAENAHLAAIIASSEDPIIGLDTDGRVRSWNAAAAAMYGWSAEEVVGEAPRGIFEPEGIEQVRRALTTGQPTSRFETVSLHRSGARTPTSVSVSPIVGPGGLEGASIVARDISELDRARRENVELASSLERRVEARTEELAQSNRDLERFAYIASHDMQEPLRMVSAFMDLLLEEHGDALDEEARSYVGFAVDGARRMQRMLRGLLEYSRARSDAVESVPFRLRDAVDGAQANLQLRLEEEGARVSVGALPRVLADPNQLTQVFQNLFGNAVKFRSEAPPTIEVDAEEEAGRARVRVRDNGIGIDEAHAERVFGVFMRLHPQDQYEGSGIGLAVCRRVIERNGGRMWLESEPGRGTSFFFTLPLAEDS